MTNNKNNTTLSESEKHQHHVEGGYKATLTNPKASEEAKKHAQEMLDKLSKGEKISDEDRTKTNNYAAQYSEEEKHQHHIEGGYKATLTNPKASEEAKKHAQEMLDKLAKGEELSAEDKQNSSNYAAEYTEEEKHNHHVAGGYKATLSNPNSSEEAKKHAKEQLEKLGEEYSKDDKSESHGHKRSADESNESSKGKKSDKEESHKGKQGFASMSKEKVQEIASKGGRTVNAGEEPLPKKGKTDESESKKSDNSKKSSKDTADLTEEEKHNHHVAGGYKATLSNPNSSEEAKKHAKEQLEKLGEEYSKDDKSESHGHKRSADESGETDSNEGHKGKQGFASMPKEKVQEIASKGGRTVNAGEEPLPKKGKTDESESKKTDSPKKSSKDTSDLSEEQKHNHHVAGGYKATLSNPNSSEEAKKHAQEMLDSMDVEYSKDDKETKSSDKDSKKSDKEEGHKGKQGFASMPKEKVQEIASKGGRTKHAGEEPTSVKQQ